MDLSREYTPRDVIAGINYFAADGKVREPESFKHPCLGVGDEHTRAMTIHDVRTIEGRFELDKNGFQFVKLPTKERNTTDDEIITSEYYAEMEELMKKMTGASTVHVFNHVIRQFTPTIDEGESDTKGRRHLSPSGHPHVDYCGVPELLEGTKTEILLPEGITKLYDTSSRFCFLGAWRPIKPLQRDPLAVADSMTVPDSDYLLRARAFPSGVKSGNYIMSHGSREDQHQWYYMHQMQPDELVVFKGYDTKQDLPGWRCPHTAIMLPGTKDLPPRESIECRAVCFFD